MAKNSANVFSRLSLFFIRSVVCFIMALLMVMHMRQCGELTDVIPKGVVAGMPAPM